jgi:hypothetical protein
MSPTQKEKIETHTDAPLQIITKNAIEKDDVAEDCIEVALERRTRAFTLNGYNKKCNFLIPSFQM